MERTGELMRDTPLTARQKAVYWAEYALRHNGAPHLRSAAANMPWHQLLLLDVLAALILAVLVSVWLIKVTVSFLLKLLLGSRKKRKSD